MKIRVIKLMNENMLEIVIYFFQMLSVWIVRLDILNICKYISLCGSTCCYCIAM